MAPRLPITRRALALAGAGVLVALSACQREPVVIDRPVRLNTLGACPVAADKAYALLYSHGDFEPQTSHVESLYLRDAGRLLTGFRTDVRAVVADVSQPGQSSGFLGVSRVPGAGPIDLLLLPRGEACAVSAPIERRSGGTLAAIDDAHVLYAGGITDGGQVPRTYLADLAKGTVTALPFGLGARRIAPTITSFDRGSRGLDRGALVVGGTDPVGNVPLRSAEVYVPGADGAPGDFEREKIELNDARAEHAAVTLTSGATLLVGGRGPQGLLTTLEVVEPTGRSRIEGLGRLEVPRKNPTAIRLASGEILVAGGEDANGAPVATLEWLAPDASRATKRRRDLVASKRRMFVPLSTGGALAVIAPDAPDATFKSVWVISADGTLEAGIPVQDMDFVRLFPGADGAPLFFTGRRWLRWQPWFGAFQQLLDAPTPTVGEGGPAAAASIAAPDPGLAVWVDERPEGAVLRAFRHGVRGDFGTVPRPLLVKDETFLAPDRLPSRDAYRFELDRGLLLGPGASAFLPDVSFSRVVVELRVTAAAPLVVLRDETGAELEVGGAFCAGAAAARSSLVVTREGAKVTYAIDGDAAKECARGVSENARVYVGLRGASGAGTSGARNLFVRRE